MKYTVSKINRHLLLVLPSAYICGVRVSSIDTQKCEVKVKHRWINQNPFKSVYFAVQTMAAEISTGVLLMNAIAETNEKISMLILNTKSHFSKKATGLITFSCTQGQEIIQAVQKAITTQESVTIWVKSIGKNQQDEVVSVTEFEWTLKIKK